jgi:hypothetical protein
MKVFFRLAIPSILIPFFATNAALGQSALDQNTVSIAVFNPFLTDSIFYCGKDSLELDAGAGFNSYRWNTGDTTQTIKVAWSDTYYVDVTHQTGSKYSDTVFVSAIRYSIDAYSTQNIPIGVQFDSVSNQTLSVSLQYPFNRETVLNNSKGSIWVANEDVVLDSITFSVVSYSPATTEPSYGIVTVHEVAGDVFNGIATLKGTYYWTVTKPGLVQMPMGIYLSKGKTYRFTFAKGPQSTQSFYGNTSNLRAGVIKGFSSLKFGSAEVFSAMTNGVWMQLHGKHTVYTGSGNTFYSCYNNPVLLNVKGGIYNYAWSTGEVLPTIKTIPKNDTTIYLSVKNDYHSCKDSINIQVFNTAFNPFTKDSIFACSQKQINLTAGTSSFSNYSWNTSNQTTPEIVANTDGWYKVSALGEQNCMATDSVFVSLSGTVTKQYKFTGNGLYSNANNWERRSKPPTVIGPYESIIIDPDGTCTMDVPQTISNCSSFIVRQRGKLIIRSGLKIEQ